MSAQDLEQARLALALEAAAMGTWTWDMSAARTRWDHRLEELHGLPPGAFGGTFDDWVEALHPEDRDACLERVQDALANPGPYALLHRTIWADGSVHWIECRGRVTVDAAGTPTGTIGVAHDVTARVQREAAVVQELRQTHDEVRQLQRTLLPERLPAVLGVEVAARYEAARSTVVGGDWYAVVPLSGHRVGLGIGDVAGHGLPAVAAMASARFSLRALALTDESASGVLNRLGEAFTRFEQDTLMTALYGILDPAALTWSFASAGHCPAVRRSADGTVALIPTRAQAPIGLGCQYTEATLSLERGDTIVAYTDGLIERRGETLTAGLNRLCVVLQNGPETPDALVDHLSRCMIDADSNDDDIAILAVSVS